MIELIGTDNVKLSSKEMDLITQLVIKEEEMETIEKMNKVQKSEDKDDVTQAAIPNVQSTTENSPKKILTPIVDSKIPPLPPTSTIKPDESKKL